MANIYKFLPELQGAELGYVQQLLKDYTDEEGQYFANIYRMRRKDPQVILLATLLGFFGVAGIQRFLVGEIGMGVLYLFTAGLCLIGTIVDLVNYQNIAFEFNQRQAYEVSMIVKGSK